ncbi:MAG TPA: CocE/NonD family hydrolase, partial [Vicinamibacterales bacterium]|nr:CocE/NonD family hydrolase [Vicinamibacterales bacterium]
RLQQGTALTYTTAPFKRRMSIAGPIAATLYARSDRPDSSTIVTLQDVAPNGRSAPLTGGQLLGSFRATKPRRAWRLGGRLVAPYHPFTKASRRPMATGEVERLDMEVLPVLASIAPGHRLRLTITTNLTPILMPPPAEFADLIGGTTSYQRSARHPSRVNLPLIPSARLRTSDQSWGACASSC